EQAQGAEVVDGVFGVLAAGAGKLPADEARALVAKADQAAAAFGSPWQRGIPQRLTETLMGQKGLEAGALEPAQRTGQPLQPTDSLNAQLQVLGSLARALSQAGKADEAKQVKARVAELERKDLEEFESKIFTFKPLQYPGRRAKSDRAVLFELFTG